jgi:hypothetical protein
MEKSEIKNLLSRRGELAYIHDQFDKSCIQDTSNNIYTGSKDSITSIIYNIDIELMKYIKSDPVGNWIYKIKGMTPDIAAGLLVYFNAEGKDCAAQFIRYCGIDNRSLAHNENARAIVNKAVDNFINCEDSMYGKLKQQKCDELIDKGVDKIYADIRSRRFISKLFVSHLFEEMYRELHDGELPKRYDYQDTVIIEPEVKYTK